MKQITAQRHEVIMAGLGGQGVLVAGQMLGEIGMSRYKHVLWFPLYTAQIRGGPNECTVILADEEIKSPVIDKAEAVIVFDPSRLGAFQKKVLPGGILIVNSTGLEAKVETEAGSVLLIPATKLALDIGSAMAINLVLLGAYIEATKVFPIEVAVEAIRERFGDREDLLSYNTKGLIEGARVVASRNVENVARKFY